MANLPGILQDGSSNNVLPTPHSYASVIETSRTASQAYVKGAPIEINVPNNTAYNGLFKAKTAIASGATFTIGTNIEATTLGEVANQVWANGSPFYLDVQSGKYGYNTSASRGADTFVPFSGSVKCIGTYSSNTTINVSAYGATSASQFLAVTSSGGWTALADYLNGHWARYGATFTAASLSLSGNNLTVNVPYMYSEGAEGKGYYHVTLPVTIYYVGEID